MSGDEGYGAERLKKSREFVTVMVILLAFRRLATVFQSGVMDYLLNLQHCLLDSIQPPLLQGLDDADLIAIFLLFFQFLISQQCHLHNNYHTHEQVYHCI